MRGGTYVSSTHRNRGPDRRRRDLGRRTDRTRHELVIAGINYSNDGLYPEILEYLTYATLEDLGGRAARCLR
jgi:hypothetical protein